MTETTIRSTERVLEEYSPVWEANDLDAIVATLAPWARAAS